MYTNVWFKKGFLIHIILPPVSDHYIPLDTFKHAIVEDEKAILSQWLDSKGFRIDSIRIDAELVTVLDATYMRSLNMIIGQVKYPLYSSKVLNTVKRTLETKWVILVNGTKYYYNLELDKYAYYIQNGVLSRNALFENGSENSPQPLPLPMFYEPIYHFEKVMPVFFITKMYFCEQVELLPEEWIPDYQGIRLNVTGKGNDAYLGDAEINYRQKTDGTWQVHICVEDFKSQFSSTEVNSGKPLGRNISNLVMIFVNIV